MFVFVVPDSFGSAPSDWEYVSGLIAAEMMMAMMMMMIRPEDRSHAHAGSHSSGGHPMSRISMFSLINIINMAGYVSCCLRAPEHAANSLLIITNSNRGPEKSQYAYLLLPVQPGPDRSRHFSSGALLTNTVRCFYSKEEF